MAVIELPIDKGYVRHWGVWEGVREIIQNALDEQDNGNPMTIEYDENHNSLSVENEGSRLDVKHLLLGHTTKAGIAKMRGEKGEGLDLALLTLARAGLQVKIYAGDTLWTPKLKYSDSWGTEVLFVNTRRIKRIIDSTKVIIEGIDHEGWEKFSNRFIPLLDLPDDCMVHNDYYGTLIDHDSVRGHVFVKDIWVQYDKKLKYGYNLKNVELDRDRNMVKNFHLSYHIGHLLEVAMRYRREFANSVYNQLKRDEGDITVVNDADTLIDGSAGDNKIVELFKAEYGEDAVPVSDMQESERVKAQGGHAIVVSRKMQGVLRGQVKTVEELSEQLTRCVNGYLNIDDLNDLQRACYNFAMNTLKTVFGDDIFNQVGITIAEFAKDDSMGFYNPEQNMITLNVLHLNGDKFSVLATLLHEFAHFKSNEPDGSVEFEATLEVYWQKVAQYFYSKNY